MWIEITRGLRLSTWSVRGAFVLSPSVVFSNILDSADLILCNYDPKKLTFPVRGHRCASHWSRVEALRLWTTQKQWSLVFTSHCPKNWLLPLRGKCVLWSFKIDKWNTGLVFGIVIDHGYLLIKVVSFFSVLLLLK